MFVNVNYHFVTQLKILQMKAYLKFDKIFKMIIKLDSNSKISYLV